MSPLIRSSYPLILLLCVLSACRGKNDRKHASSVSTSASAPQPRPDGLSIDDKPVKFRSALAIGTTGQSSLLVTLATKALDCKTLRDAYPQRPKDLGGTTTQLWFSQGLNSDGSRTPWHFRSAYLHDEAGWRQLRTQGALMDEATLDQEGLLLRGLELAMLDRRKKDRRIAYQGTLEAQLCGRKDRAEKSRPQTSLTLKLADVPQTILGASLRLDKDRYHLRLSPAPHDCQTRFTEDYDFYLDLVIEKKPISLKFASLQGSLFPNEPTGSSGRDQFELSLPSQLKGRSTIPVALKGKLALRSYSVSLDGQVQAQVCVPSSTAD